MRTIFKLNEPLTRCKVATSVILLVGFSVSAVIFLNATEAPEDPMAQFEKSKKYAYELERMGGKAALAADSINKWFTGLWYGETFAYTVAAITVIVAIGYYFVASSLEIEAKNLHDEG